MSDREMRCEMRELLAEFKKKMRKGAEFMKKAFEEIKKKFEEECIERVMLIKENKSLRGMCSKHESSIAELQKWLDPRCCPTAPAYLKEAY